MGGPSAEQELRSSLDALDEAIFRMKAVRDTSGTLVDFEYRYCNPAALRVLGRSRDDVVGRRLLELFPSHRSNGLFDAYVRVTETGEPLRYEFAFDEGGVIGEFEVIASPVGDGYIVAGHDISDRKRLERELVAVKDQLQAALTSRVVVEQAEQALPVQRDADAAPTALPVDADVARDLLVLAFANSPLGMTLGDVRDAGLDGHRPRAILINNAFAEMLGYPMEELLTATDQSVFTHEEDRASDLATMRSLLGGEVQSAHWDKRYVHADGHVVWGRVSASVLRSADGLPRYVVAQVQDVTERREDEARLLQRAEQDALTGLLNRSAFAQHAHEQLTRCARYGERASLLLIDVDDLKLINDRSGHVVGDRALTAVAETLRKRLRDGDVAARLGGDEFVALLPHTDVVEAQHLADAITSNIEGRRIATDKGDVLVTASVGSAEITSATTDIEQALAEADREMYVVKRLQKSLRNSAR
jgi:diguanylate cyclase (GGDEF)-like protein/PAS domain S-box-containing protein